MGTRGARTLARNIDSRAPQWVVDGYFARGVVSLIAGPGGIGKGLTSVWLASRLSTTGDEPLTVWISSSSEDDLAMVLKPRLDIAGADLDRVHVTDVEYDLPADADRMRTEVLRGRVDCLIVDSLQTHAAGGRGEVAAMVALAELAKSTNIAVIVVHHLLKSVGRNAAAAVAGSTQIRNRARAIYLLGPQPGEDPAARELRDIRARLLGTEDEIDEREKLVLACSKMNFARYPSSLAFAVQVEEVGHPDGTKSEQAYLEFVEEVAFTAEEVLAAIAEHRKRPDQEQGLVQGQAVWILEALAASPIRGMTTSSLVAMAKSDAVFTGERTFQRARALAGVKPISPKSLDRYLSPEDFAALSDEDRRSWWVFI